MEYLFQTQRVSIINIPKAIRNTCYKIIKMRQDNLIKII